MWLRRLAHNWLLFAHSTAPDLNGDKKGLGTSRRAGLTLGRTLLVLISADKAVEWFDMWP